MAKLPLRVRFFLALDRCLNRLTRIFHVVRDSFLWASTKSEQREKINRTIYSREKGYISNGEYFNQGLFQWEKDALTLPLFPKKGRILLGGAGGGREALSLVKKGYEVLAFEPCNNLFQKARSTLQSYSNCEIVCASYQDLILAVQSQTGPLHEKLFHQAFDAFIFGWGSFSHLLTEEDRIQILQCIRVVCPTGPILLSFLTPPLGRSGRIEQMKPRLKKVLEKITLGTHSDFYDAFLPGSGFVHLFTPDEVKTLGRKAGYTVIKGNLSPYPHAVLCPMQNEHSF